MKLFWGLAATGVFMFLALLYFAVSWADSEQAYEALAAEHAQEATELAEAQKALFVARVALSECHDADE